jgi:predicted PurR-regulated permease PerM
MPYDLKEMSEHKTVTIPVPNRREVRDIAVKAVLLIVLLYLAYVVRSIWIPLGLSFLIAMVLDPIVDRMEVRGWKRATASAFIFGSFLIITIGLAILSFPAIASQAANLQAGVEKYFPDTSRAGLKKSFLELGMPQGMLGTVLNFVEGAKKNFTQSSGWMAEYGMSVATNVVWIVIIPIVAFYTLRDFHLILAKGLLLVPAGRRDLVQTAVTEITAIFGKYLRGLAIVSALNGIATGAMLFVMGVPGALLLGVISAFLYSVPYVGAVLTILLTAAITFVGAGPQLMLYAVMASFVLHHIIFDQIITPKILGDHVGIHPLLSIFALLVGNLLLGIIGMVLAVPIAACVQIAVLAVVPKLKHDIDIATPNGETDTVQSLEEETKESHQKVDATEDLHAAVKQAVDTVEVAVEEAESKPAEPV